MVDNLQFSGQGSCYGLPTHEWDTLFFGKSARKAKMEFCNDCPIIMECLEWALKHDERGVWGGTTDKERRQIKRLNQAAVKRKIVRRTNFTFK
jgi:predicted Fe-S protein YdhL (DUF1289 family)